MPDGKVVPLSLLDEVLNKDLPRSELKQLVHSMAIPIDREVGRNDIIQQILRVKLGHKFVISRKPMTKRKGKSFSAYSRSSYDPLRLSDLCAGWSASCAHASPVWYTGIRDFPSDLGARVTRPAGRSVAWAYRITLQKWMHSAQCIQK